MNGINICVVIVTYNRLDKLKNALECYNSMTIKPLCFVIVDNGSTDGTDIFLDEWKNIESGYSKYIISLKENTGGSGGFSRGLEFAKDLGCDWIWVSDDDAYPQQNVFEILLDYMCDGVSAVCTRIENADGIDTWHRRRLKHHLFTIKEERVGVEEYGSCFEIDLFSYVGTMLSVKAIVKAGFPEKNFFISYDDTEHSIRMGKEGKIICVPSAVVYHDSLGVTENVLSWKKYYAVRNKIYSYKKHYNVRYSFVLSVYYIIKAILIMLRKYDIREYQIVKKAVLDGNMGKLGVDEIYVPGWK